MMMKQSGGNSVIREINKKKILSYIRLHAPVSRNVMCREIGISAATGTRVVEQLIAEGLVLELEMKEGQLPEGQNSAKKQAGRNPVYLELNAEAKYCFGVNLSRHTMGIALIDFCLNTVEKYVAAISDIDNVEELLDMTGDILETMMVSRKIPASKIMGIGVGTPGFVDMKTGIVKNFGISRFASLPIREYLIKRFNLPVIVDNNANTRMLGELWNGYATHCKNAVFVVNNEGVGSGILYNGSILADTNHFTAGLGHISVNFEGELCSCGNRGCVELYCGTDYLEQKANELAVDGGPYHYKELSKLVDRGDETFLPLFEQAAMAMSSGLTALITIVCPEVIILSGTLFDASDYYYNRVVELTIEKTGIVMRKPVFKRRRVKDGIYEIGAAALFFRKYYGE